MSIFSGTSEFGSAVFGGDPAPILYLDIDAEITTDARRMMAVGLWEGISLLGYYFSVGSNGHEPLNYKAALPVNPDCIDGGFSSYYEIPYIEHPNDASTCFYCPLDWSFSSAISSVAIWSKIKYEGNTNIAGDIIFAIGHFPLICINDRTTVVLRVTVQA